MALIWAAFRLVTMPVEEGLERDGPMLLGSWTGSVSADKGCGDG